MLQELLLRATQLENLRIAAPKAMLVFAHPDDETVALGARLGHFAQACIVHVTDGAPRNEQDSRALGFRNYKQYREVREGELRRALRMAGLEKSEHISLQIPDQQASFNLPWLTREIQALISTHRPEVIFTHPYEGGHPDHDACAFAVHTAVAGAEMDEGQAPAIIEAAFYHAGAHGIETECFLPHAGSGEEICCELSTEERHRKRRLLACFASQQGMLRCFAVKHERFRVAPVYDFHGPPHAGLLFYENYLWGMTSQRFCELAMEAEDLVKAEMERCH
jgi:LmbE family N-acetylglucosaminyl deacetylase